MVGRCLDGPQSCLDGPPFSCRVRAGTACRERGPDMARPSCCADTNTTSIVSCHVFSGVWCRSSCITHIDIYNSQVGSTETSQPAVAHEPFSMELTPACK
jgi:hypothetical protein